MHDSIRNIIPSTVEIVEITINASGSLNSIIIIIISASTNTQSIIHNILIV